MKGKLLGRISKERRERMEQNKWKRSEATNVDPLLFSDSNWAGIKGGKA